MPRIQNGQKSYVNDPSASSAHNSNFSLVELLRQPTNWRCYSSFTKTSEIRAAATCFVSVDVRNLGQKPKRW